MANEHLETAEWRKAPELMAELEESLYSAAAIRFSAARSSGLWDKVKARAIKRGALSMSKYMDLLKSDPSEMGDLIEEITTKETYFFRIPSHFESLRNKVLPDIEERLSMKACSTRSEAFDTPIRIWSAGCATGEEAYSIAATVKRGLKFLKAWKVEILATDVSLEALRTAGRGSYEKLSMDRTPQGYGGFVMKCGGTKDHRLCGEDFCRVDEDLQRMIAFRKYNLKDLLENGPMTARFLGIAGGGETMDLRGRFDAIFCRNVMIYFDFAAQQKLIDRLHECLKPGGYLFTGDAEQLHIYDHDFQPQSDGGAFYYRKTNPANAA